MRARFKKHAEQGRGRKPGTSRIEYLLSGLMRCACCAGRMSIVSRTTKKARVYANYGCAAHYQKGDAICPNNLTVSERKAVEGIVGAIREMADEPGVIARFIEKFNVTLQRRRRVPPPHAGRAHSTGAGAGEGSGR